MKLIITLALMGLILLSCKSDGKKDAPLSADATLPAVPQSIPFAGDWLSESYLNSLSKDKSPRKAQEGSEDCFIHIPSQPGQIATMVYNFHEAGAALVVASNQNKFQFWESINDSLVEMKYEIELLSPEKIKIGDQVFSKINIASDSDQPKILEEILFRGVYHDENDKKVEFKSTGEVTGLGQYKYYHPLIDYFDVGLQVDQVGLGETKENMEYFGFSYKKNKLDIYKLKCKTFDDTNNCVEVRFGEKQFELTHLD